MKEKPHEKSLMKSCPICDKKVRARGYISHIRLAHPNSIRNNQTKVEFLEDNKENLKDMSSIGYVSTKSIKRKRSYNEASIGELIALFGVAYVLFEVYKYVNSTKTLKSEPNKPTHRHMVLK